MLYLLLLLIGSALGATPTGPPIVPGCGLDRLVGQGPDPVKAPKAGTTEVKYVDGKDDQITVFTQAYENDGALTWAKYIFDKRPDGKYDVAKIVVEEDISGNELTRQSSVYLSDKPPVSAEGIIRANAGVIEQRKYLAKLEATFVARHGLTAGDFLKIKTVLNRKNEREKKGWDDAEILVKASNEAIQAMPAARIAESLVAGIKFSSISRARFSEHLKDPTQYRDTVFDDAQYRYTDMLAALNAPSESGVDVAKLKREVLVEIVKSGALRR